MIGELERKIADTALLNSKLILLIGPPRSGKTALLGQLSGHMKVPVLKLGLALGRDLLGLPRTLTPAGIRAFQRLGGYGSRSRSALGRQH